MLGYRQDSLQLFKLLHTSDWHLGKELLGESTIEVSRAMLEWLLGVCKERAVDGLVVAGDVFDVSTPSNQAQKLYYGFLARVQRTGCRHVVITPGNHDSANFLRAPAEMLSQRGIIVSGPDPESEAVVLCDAEGRPELGVAAVPFLRESDMRASVEEITEGERWALYGRGVAAHYSRVRAALERKMGESPAPRIAAGHFFATGAAVTPDPDTGEAPVTVGTLGAVPVSVAGGDWDYVCLGHIHRPQKVGGDAVRYCGSPYPLSFREVDNSSQVVLVTLRGHGEPPEIEPIPVPRFQPMVRLEGDADALRAALDRVSREQPGAWVEANYTGVSEQLELNEELGSLAGRLGVRLLAVRNQLAFRKALEATADAVSLHDFTPEQVFLQFLKDAHADEASTRRMLGTFREAAALVEADRAARRASSRDDGPAQPQPKESK